jgi:AmpE protein
MSLLVILLVLLVQRFLAFDIPEPKGDWFVVYAKRLEGACVRLPKFQGWLGVLLLMASAVLIYALAIGLLEHVLGFSFTFIFHVLVLWYYLDAKPLNVNITDQFSIARLFSERYEQLFVILFWYILLGPAAVILYVETGRLVQALRQQQQQEAYFAEDFLLALVKCRDLADWLPARILGLTFALAGHFRPVFTAWCAGLKHLGDAGAQVAEYGQLALGWETQGALTPQTLDESESLITRSLIIWLVALFLANLGHYFQ